MASFLLHIGALGSFITGSCTVSNLLFSNFQYGVSQSLNLPAEVICTLQAVGGAMGNMICIHNIVAASATVGLAGVEGMIFKRTIVPMLIYGVIVGLIGMLMCFVL